MSKPLDPQIASALTALGAYVTGLRVLYRSFGMSLYPLDEDGGLWLAYGNPDAEDCDGYPLEVLGSGATPIEAVEACFIQCGAAESIGL